MKVLMTLTMALALLASGSIACAGETSRNRPVVIEKVSGLMHLSLLACDGQGACASQGGAEFLTSATIEIEAGTDGNNTGKAELRLPLVDGTALHLHVFVNKIIRDERESYIVTLAAYGYDPAGEDLFGMPQASMNARDLSEVDSLSLSSNEFRAIGSSRKIDFRFVRAQAD